MYSKLCKYRPWGDIRLPPAGNVGVEHVRLQPSPSGALPLHSPKTITTGTRRETSIEEETKEKEEGETVK